VNELVVMIEASWREFDTASEGLDETAMAAPGVVESWSIKDLIGHVTAWDQLAVEYLERWRHGGPEPARDWDSADTYNAQEAAWREGWTLAEVRDEAADIRRRLRAVLASITDEEWATVVRINYRGRSLGEWVGGALGGTARPGSHAAEHAARIRAWRAARETRTMP
jgi:hypothetical protein